MEKSLSLPISIYALGGLGEVGKNMYCLESERKIIIIDCGVRFPGVEFPGIDYIIPDFTHLKNNRNKIRALFITHGHEDHIGGIPFLIQTVNIPVIYAPKLAAALIRNRLEEFRIQTQTKIVEYDSNTVVNVEDWKVSFFRVTHSIPDSFGVCVDTPEGRVVSTGDFKVDLTPVGPDMELDRIAQMGIEGVDLLLSDSTNSENEGYTPSEKAVLNSIEEIFETSPGRLIVSTFSSNISRIQQLCEVAVSHNRKIVIIGRSMEKAVDISRQYGYIHIPDNSIVEADAIRALKPSEILILCTGSQGEPMAALSRIANGEHKDIHIFPGDTVVFSSSAIPGNGMMIANVVNQLTRCGADVITNSILSDIHSSGHPAKQELRLMFKLLNPKHFMPMHGEHRMLKIHAEIAQSLGIPKEKTFVLNNGETLVLSNNKVTRGYDVETGCTYIDGKGIDGLADAVIEDRKILTENGVLTICVSLDSKSNTILVPPLLYQKGLINKGSSKIDMECRALIEKGINGVLQNKPSYAEIKNIIKKIAGEFFLKRTGGQPMIIPVIMSKN